MEPSIGAWQWNMSITIHHGPGFGHRISMEQVWKGRTNALETPLGRWSGLGIPEQTLRSASGIIVATFEEHVMTRYGVAGELPVKWSGEPDPF